MKFLNFYKSIMFHLTLNNQMYFLIVYLKLKVINILKLTPTNHLNTHNVLIMNLIDHNKLSTFILTVK